MANTPVGKYGQPEDLQGALLFLLSEMSSFITGIVLPVDGGYSAYGRGIDFYMIITEKYDILSTWIGKYSSFWQ